MVKHWKKKTLGRLVKNETNSIEELESAEKKKRRKKWEERKKLYVWKIETVKRIWKVRNTSLSFIVFQLIWTSYAHAENRSTNCSMLIENIFRLSYVPGSSSLFHTHQIVTNYRQGLFQRMLDDLVKICWNFLRNKTANVEGVSSLHMSERFISPRKQGRSK